MAGYCTISDVRATMNVVARLEANVAEWIEQAKDWIDRECGRTFNPATELTEYYSGSDAEFVRCGRTRLYPRHRPIVTVTSLHDDTDLDYGSDTEISAWTSSSTDAGYVLVPGFDAQDPTSGGVALELRGTSFSTTTNAIRLVYQGGYNATPIHINRASVAWVQLQAEPQRFLASLSGGGVTKNFGPETGEEWIRKTFLSPWRL